MTKFKLILFACITAGFLGSVTVFAQTNDAKLIFIRHAEKPLKGSNLTCQGLNRALKLSAVIIKKFGMPDYLLVPALGLGDTTKHSRMFQTIAPLAMKYNMVVNSAHSEKDYQQIAADLRNRAGTTIIIWEHKGIPEIIKALGITENLTWPDDDYDSIWIVDYKYGKALLSKDKENIRPEAGCSF